nr:MAG TPA: hypothetical protein [Bacteriophage sp.]
MITEFKTSASLLENNKDPLSVIWLFLTMCCVGLSSGFSF